MKDDDTLFGEADSKKTDPEPADAEQADALSRAAREAVRQPADPRIEKSFAHLSESDAEARAAQGGAVAAEVDALRGEMTAWRSSAADLARRLAVVTWVLLGLTAIIGLLAIVLIIRS